MTNKLWVITLDDICKTIMKDPLKEIINIVGNDHILSLPTELEHYSVDGIKPNLVVFSETIEAISEIMKVASSEHLAITPWGGGTKIGFGRVPDKVDVIVCTARLNRILEHEASDLIATAECGVSLKKFQAELREKNQFLAIDPPHVELGATVGGIIATNDSGPKRLKFGTMRESLIGIKVVKPDGSIVKGGAKVVKNVAGYDLPKLYVGSLGTLGIIVEGTFRLYPIPEASKTYLATFPNLEIFQETVLSILNSSIVPTCFEVLNPDLISAISNNLNLNLKKEKYALAVRIESVEKAVREQISKVKQISEEKNGEGILLKGDIEENLWQEIREFPWRISCDNRTVCKASVLIADVPRVFQAAEELCKKSGLKIYISGRAGNGVLIFAIEVERPFDYAQGSPQEEMLAVVEAIKSLRALVSSLKGTLVIQDAPISIKSQVDVWGDLGTSHKVMEKLKNLFDPYQILNPGRFI